MRDQASGADMQGWASVSPTQSRDPLGDRLIGNRRHRRRHRLLGGFPMIVEDPSRDLYMAHPVRVGRPASSHGRAL